MSIDTDSFFPSLAIALVLMSRAVDTLSITLVLLLNVGYIYIVAVLNAYIRGGSAMDIIVREYKKNDTSQMIEIWNEVVDSGIAFPQIERLTGIEAGDFFSGQSFTGIAENVDTNEMLGLYILHPNNIGRCGHISNASYAVKSAARGLQIGEKLVKHSMEKAKELGFNILQFNAVVKTNYNAINLYEKLGFVKLGAIPNGFLIKDGYYEDIIIFYRVL